MTHVEFVADALRHQDQREKHLPDGLPWAYLQPSEQRRWKTRAQVAIDAYDVWRPGRVYDAQRDAA